MRALRIRLPIPLDLKDPEGCRFSSFRKMRLFLSQHVLDLSD